MAEIAVIIPAYNEAESIGRVLDALPREVVKQVVVVDNGSTDGTGEVARGHGALVVHEPRRGYGAACLAGMAALQEGVEIVVFIDGDYSDYPEELPRLVAPIASGEVDLVIGSRALGQCQRGAIAPHARWGNRLAVTLLRLLFDVQFTDLGPFRAIRASALRGLGMADQDYGWTVEMQARAARAGLRATEVPVSYRRRVGRSKVSGTVRGSVLAGYKILTTIWRVWREKGVVLASSPSPVPLPRGEVGLSPSARSRAPAPLVGEGRGEGAERAPTGGEERITVIIPTLDEERNIGPCLATFAAQEGPLEIIVADGGSSDRTTEIARRVPGVRVVLGPRGRGPQMNTGAREATGEILWFVHADCRPPAGAAAAIRRTLARGGVSGGALRFALAARGWGYRVVEWGVRLRCRLFRLPYGDQGLFLRRDLFEQLGGFRETPLFEDLYLVRALRRRGRVVTLPATLPTSPRRCMRDGILRTVLRNQALLLAERLGIPPERLVKLRPPATAQPPDRRPVEGAGAASPSRSPLSPFPPSSGEGRDVRTTSAAAERLIPVNRSPR